MSKANNKAAVRRLFRDLKEWQHMKQEIRSISAAPLKDNIQEWHVNIKAPEGSVYDTKDVFMLHLIITFPDNYPSAPPRVAVMTSFEHPNVYSNSICLSMLRPHTLGVPYEGWSSSYSVSSILMQLQTFLFAENIPQDGGYNVKSSAFSPYILQKCKVFKCGRCHHTYKKPCPRFLTDNKKRKMQKSKRKRTTKLIGSATERLYDVLWVIIFEFLEIQDLSRASRVCRYYKQIIASHNVCERLSISCFHTKKKVSDGETILGLPFHVTENPHNFRRTFTSQMDFICWEAWNEGVRRGVWGEELTHFLPVIINKQHSQRVKSLFSSCLSQLVGSERKGLKTGEVLGILANMMNMIVVDFVQSETEKRRRSTRNGFSDERFFESSRNKIPMRMCHKVLTGYVSLYHMLLWFGHKHPSMVAHANKVVERFKNNRKKRRKEHTPDLGKFLIYVLVSEYDWEYVAREFMDESMTRKVLWTIKAHRALNSLVPYRERLQFSLAPSLVGRRLLMFQIWFMKQFSPVNKKDLLQTLNGYNRRYGCAPSELQSELFETCKRILAMQKGGSELNLGMFRPRSQEQESLMRAGRITYAFLEREEACLEEWNGYFSCVGFQKMKAQTLNEYLTWCVWESLKAGYHRNFSIPQEHLFDMEVKRVHLRMIRTKRKKAAVKMDEEDTKAQAPRNGRKKNESAKNGHPRQNARKNLPLKNGGRSNKGRGPKKQVRQREETKSQETTAKRRRNKRKRN